MFRCQISYKMLCYTLCESEMNRGMVDGTTNDGASTVYIQTEKE